MDNNDNDSSSKKNNKFKNSKNNNFKNNNNIDDFNNKLNNKNVNYNKKYFINFIIYFITIYVILIALEKYISQILSFLISIILNTDFSENCIVYGNKIYTIISACTCSLEIALFTGYVLGTPKIDIKYKLLYSLFGIIIINLANIFRIISIITLNNRYNILNYSFIHDTLSFILFPVALILNILWIYILKKKGLIVK